MQESFRSIEPVHRPSFEVVAVAASLGGLQVLSQVLSGLPAAFPVPVVVVLHISPTFRSHTAEVLGWRTPLRTVPVEGEEPMEPGTVYVAPPGRHVVIAPEGRIALSDAPAVHFARPAADVLFASAAEQCGARALGVVLTGRGSDGADGARAMRRRGGVVIVQSPESCAAPGMPHAVLLGGGADFVLPPENIASALVSLVMVPGALSLFELTAA